MTSEIFGDEIMDAINRSVSRQVAMGVPAVSKARNLLVSTVAKFPLVAVNREGLLTAQPTWFYRTDSDVTPYERMAWTVDDLIFYGNCLWLRKNGVEQDGRKPILDAYYVPRRDWTITDGNILVQEQPVADDEIIFINSPFEGLLNIASRTIRGARDQENAWVARTRNPIPLIELHQTDDSLEAEEVPAFVQAWADARMSDNGAVGYTPPGLEIRVHGTAVTDLMIEGRNASRTDIGSFLNVRASMLDGTIGIDSLTYTTTEGERNAFYEFDLPFWTDPIAARLSMDDIVPRGTAVRFDMYSAFNPPTATGPNPED
ncbi:MAG: phage portal protein [Leifsonia sp.]